MPELPEVETTRCGIAPHLNNKTIQTIIIRQPKLRWKVDVNFSQLISNRLLQSIERRGKYLIFNLDNGTFLIHLGMSGKLRILSNQEEPEKHDHFDIIFTHGKILRFTDPRRFGMLIWTDTTPHQHSLLKELGPEPLENNFTGAYLFQLSRKRKAPVKQFIMDQNIVVGVGNIYANEALFAAKINPLKAANKISAAAYNLLVKEIKKVLAKAIKKGGTTLRDFMSADNKPGYFQLRLKVYGRGNLSCVNCETLLKEIRLGQRSTVYCPTCQK